jgi:hypothetical protein
MHHGMDGGMRHGMMQGIGPGAIYGMPGRRSLDLSVEDVEERFQARLEHHGNPRLKLGPVAVSDDDEDTIMVDIVTVDDSLVQRWLVDRRTGFMEQDE